MRETTDTSELRYDRNKGSSQKLEHSRDHLERGGDIEDDWAVGLTGRPLNIHGGQTGARCQRRRQERPCHHVVTCVAM